MKVVAQRSASVTSNISDKTAAYVANKTMVGRASTALTKALPVVVSSLCNDASNGGGISLEVNYVFQQGGVIALEVKLKASSLSSYVAAVQGDDAAEHYRCAVSSLKLLGAFETMGSLEKEMLPMVRTGLMEKMSKGLVRIMKEKDGSGVPLEVDCIALEEKEEARWLFTFMQFQSQMK